MEGAKLAQTSKEEKRTQKTKITWKKVKEQRTLILLSIPFVIWLLVFAYGPLAGWIMAFQDYKPQNGILGSQWVGLEHFKTLFNEPTFYNALKNTVGMGLLGLVFGTIAAISFALMLNEIRFTRLKKLTQTISYLPHFVSWVVVANIVISALSQTGMINEFLINLNIIDGPINFMAEPNKFWGIVRSLMSGKRQDGMRLSI